MKQIVFIITIIIIFFGNLCAQVNLDSGLVAHYPFNGNANDESGNDNHGTVMGAVLTSDRFGSDNSAYEFDGMASYITIGSSPTLESPSTELTQGAWIDIHAWSLVGQQNVGPITMKSNSGSNAFQYRLSVAFDGINTAINNWNNAVIILDTLNFNEWYFIVTTLKNDTVKTYVNGNFIGEGTLTGPINPDTRPLEIGRDVPGDTEVFNGKLDDIRIYNRALNEVEIDSLYNEGVTSVDEINFIIPHTFELYQNYPNPFNPSTTIEYQIPEISFVTLKVYDVLGNEIETLINEEKPIGTHTIEFDATNLPSGIYFYKLQIPNFTQTKKMILLK
jgi:hypothetical protein